MQFDDQLKLERTVVAIIGVSGIVAGLILAHLEIATWTF